MSARAIHTAILCLLVAAPGWAQDVEPDDAPQPEASEVVYPLQVAVQLGLGGVTPGRGFMPVRVQLTPWGDTATRTVEVVVESEDGVELLRLGPAEVGAEGRRLEGTLAADALAGAGDLQVRVEAGGGEVVGRFAVEPTPTPHPVLAVVDRRGAPPADLSGVRVVSTSEDRWQPAMLLSTDGLPRSPLAWTGTGAALIGDLSVESWSEPEARAFTSWIERGGTAVFSVGERAALLRRSLVGRLLGSGLDGLPDAEPIRTDLRPALDLMADRFGIERQPGGNVTGAMARLTPGEGDEVWLRDREGRPVVVRHAHGLGDVILIAPDLWAAPFLHANATPALLEYVLRSAGHSDPRSRLLFSELAAVRQPAQTGAAFAVLITYALLVGPGIYFLLRARKRGLLVWIAIPVIATVATAVVPFYRLAIKDGESTMVGVLLREQRLGAAFSVDTVDALVFSGGLEPKELTVRGRDLVAFGMIPPPRMGRGLPQLGKVLGTDPDQLELSLPIGLWGARYVGMESGAAPVAIRGRVELSPRDTEARVVIEHDAPWALDDAVIIYPTNVATMLQAFDDSIESGARIDMVTQPSQAGSWQPDAGELEAALMHRMLFARYMHAAEVSRSPFLLASVELPSPIFTGPNLRTRTFVGLVAVELELGYRGGFPFGVAQQEPDARTVRQLDEDTVERERTTRFKFPMPADAASISALRVQVNAPGPRIERLDLAVWVPAEERWEPLDLTGPHAERDPTRAERVTLEFALPALEGQPDVSGWIAGGEMLVRQRFVRRAAQGRDGNHTAELGLSLTWTE